MKKGKLPVRSPSLTSRLYTFFAAHAFSIALVGIFIIGLVLRLWPAYTRQFWEDELATYAFATSPYSWIEQLIRPADDRPPLFYLIIRLFTKFTQNEFLLRLPGILLSWFSVFITYKAIRRYSKKAAWFVTFILLFSLVRIEYSWQLRDYSILMVPTSLMLYFFTRFIEKLLGKGVMSKKDVYGLTISAFIGCMINYIFIIFTISLFSWIFIFVCRHWYTKKERVNWRFLAWSLGLQLPLVGTLLYYLSSQTQTIQETCGWIPKVSTYSYFLINAVFLGFSNNMYDLYSSDTALLRDNVILTVIILVFFIFCIYLLEKKKIAINSVIKVLFYSGIYVYVIGYIGTILCSHMLGVNMFLIRTFLRIGNMFLISFGIGVYIACKGIVKKKYISMSMLFASFMYFCVFIIMYFDWFTPSLFDFKTGIPERPGMKMVNDVWEPGDHVIYLPLYFEVLYPLYYWKDTPEKFSSLRLFMNIYVSDIDNFFVQYKQKISEDMKYTFYTPFNEKQGKIYLLNWNITGPEYEHIVRYCQETRNTEFKTIYRQSNMYVAVCE
ncbi:MAG: hypothetical protein WAV51_02105 [Microgenomates group bacterium]